MYHELNVVAALLSVATIALLVSLGTPHLANAQATPPSTHIESSRAIGGVTPFFEANEGQFDSHVTFVCRLPHKMFTFRKDGLDVDLLSPNPDEETYTVHMRYIDHSVNVSVQGEELLKGRINYMIGQHRDGWKTGVPTYRKIRYHNLYRNIDALYYANNGLIEYDLIIHAGGDPSLIRMQYDDVKGYAIDDNGNLVVDTGWDTFAELAPKAHQVIDGQREPVDVHFALRAFGEDSSSSAQPLPSFTKYIGFELGAYDDTVDLVIDPITSLPE